MTQNEAKILALYDDDSAIEFLDMEPVEWAALARLVEHGCLERVMLNRNGRVDLYGRAYRITPKGRLALQEFEENIAHNTPGECAEKAAGENGGILANGNSPGRLYWLKTFIVNVGSNIVAWLIQHFSV